MAKIKDILTVKELADIMGISRIAVFKKIKNGQIKAEKVGRNYVIYKKDIEDIVDSPLSKQMKADIARGVKKVLGEYKETLEMLGRE